MTRVRVIWPGAFFGKLGTLEKTMGHDFKQIRLDLEPGADRQWCIPLRDDEFEVLDD